MATKNKKKQVDWKVMSIGIVCVTIIELYALSQGMNGMLMSFVVGIIGLAIGVNVPNFTKK